MKRSGLSWHNKPRCYLGRTSIWSLRRTDQRGADRPVLTIEVAPHTRTIIQARGKWNRKPSTSARRIMLAWATREGLSVDDRL